MALSRSRNVGMSGALPIPVSEILAYCEFYRIAELPERDRIFRFVNRLDEAYLGYLSERQTKSPGK